MISSDIKKILFEINLTKSENLNFSYLSRDNINARLGNYEEELPLSPTKSKWQTSDEMYLGHIRLTTESTSLTLLTISLIMQIS